MHEICTTLPGYLQRREVILCTRLCHHGAMSKSVTIEPAAVAGPEKRQEAKVDDERCQRLEALRGLPVRAPPARPVRIGPSRFDDLF